MKEDEIQLYILYSLIIYYFDLAARIIINNCAKMNYYYIYYVYIICQFYLFVLYEGLSVYMMFCYFYEIYFIFMDCNSKYINSFT